MLILIKNGYVIDPASDREGIFDILIENDKILKVQSAMNIGSVKQEAEAKGAEFTLIDATGRYVMPGFIDLHVHLREPGFEYKETIATGSMAAAAGGFTTICPMPNTKPAIDSEDLILLTLKKAQEDGVVTILPIAAITLGQEGKELVAVQKLKSAGAVAISEDGKSLMDTALYAEALRLAAACQLPVFAHCEDKMLAANGVINAGKKAEELKLVGISNAVEDIITARDILLAKETGAVLHLCHVSTKDSLRMLALAKAEGLAVTGETCPHYFTLADEDIPCDNADYKMNPPLRSERDKMAMIEALKKDVIDVIATDHAPHSKEEKSRSFSEAPFGISGLETAFSLTYTELVKKGHLTPRQMVEKLSVNPARILGYDRGCIGEGKVADLVIANPDEEYSIDRDSFYSKGKNTPFHGRRVSGRIEYTFVAGKPVYKIIKNDEESLSMRK